MQVPGYAKTMRSLIVALVVAFLTALLPAQQQDKPHAVFLVGENEYGSRATMPRFAQRVRDDLHLRTTVLHSKNKELPPLDVLDSADLLVLFLRFREVSDDQLARLKQWFDAGKPCVALRTTSHAFTRHKGWFPPFFGGHYKAHAPNGQGTIGFVPDAVVGHELLRGLARSSEFGHGGTYNAQPLADAATVMLFGRTGQLPCEPIAWTHRYCESSRIFYTSLGSRDNFKRPDFQRLLGNAVLWALKREVPAAGTFAASKRVVAAPAPASEVPAPPVSNAPADAKVLFDGSTTDAFRHWDPSVAPLAIGIDGRADSSSGGEVYDEARWRIENGALVARPGFGDIVSKDEFGNYHLHVDVFVPEVAADVPAGFRGQSGIYLAGRYELQIADSFGRPSDAFAMGAIHGQHTPDASAATKAGQWQLLDIYYRHTQDARPVVSAWLNGKQIHDAVRLQSRTVYGFRAEEPLARSSGGGGDARHVRAPNESFAFGTGEFTVEARFKTKGSGTLWSKCPPKGKWRPNSKALFLRGGKLVYDIGWVGAMSSKRNYNDGKWHRVLVTHKNGTARMYVDGAQVCERADFTAKDESGHVFKIGAAANDFGGGYAGEISDVTVWEHNVPKGKAQQSTRGEVVDMGKTALRWQPKPKPVAIEPEGPKDVVGPIRLQADCSSVRFANIWVRPLATVDHRGLASKDAGSVARGEQVYVALCYSCHFDAKKHFAAGLKHGDDPRSMFDTLTNGVGDKKPMAWLPEAARYDVIHYLRQELSLPDVDAAYIAALPAGLPQSGGTSGPMPDGDWPAYRRMDYGNALHWTYEIARNNIVQKGIAIRLDEGEGGISRGRAFAVYDEDTMRLAALWTGQGFIDWKGVAFDGSHNSHAHIRGELVMATKNEPAWAVPGTCKWQDERIVGRDGKRYGPLPKSHVRYVGRQQIGRQSILEYTVGDVTVREMPGFDEVYGTQVFSRRIEVAGCDQDMWMRIAPKGEKLAWRVQLSGRTAGVAAIDDWWVIRIRPGTAQGRYLVQYTTGEQRLLEVNKVLGELPPLPDRTTTAAPLWLEECTTKMRVGEAKAAAGYVVDELPVPDLGRNPWRSWMRLGGFDFFADGKRAAVATWNGDVWVVAGVDGREELRWRRIAAGLFQPLGVRIVGETIYVGCRDQICVLEDTNGDGETDYYRCFNNDHQVTEHFHEFAMGLQTDAAGNFYYAKSARHALTALVPHHGTLLKVSKDGATTEILANGFRAANGVCVNGDGSFYVTDQEGHWTPKNRINRVTPGGFYGNMFGYHEQASSKDEDMEQPLCWLTNAFDRSPAELLRVQGNRWGLPEGALLQLSYGMGRAYLVLEDEVDGVHQGGMVTLPLEPFATGVMRGRFHQPSGQLYCCGLYGWSGARTRPGGFYRVRYTGGPIAMPTAMRSVAGGLQLTFGTELEPELAVDPESYSVKVWSLRRTKNYGSKHHDEQQLAVTKAVLSSDRKSVVLTIANLAPTMCLEVTCDLETATGVDLRAKIHGTLHRTR